MKAKQLRDFKDTLNLPKTAFPMKANLLKKEKELLTFWKEKDIYKKLQEKNKGKQSFILHDGPPYANGHIHMGHALNKILKDIIVKYYSMKGYYVPFVPGWDCHGLPIELQVEKKLGKKKDKTPLLQKRRLCREYAEKFINIQRDEFIRLGIFGDWESPYLTMDYQYEASIIEEFFRFFYEGYLYRKKKPVYWCPHCVTALAEAEVEYAEKLSPSIYVKFKLKNTDTILGKNNNLYFIVWTTTPWTLPANLALAIHPDKDYSVIEIADNYYIIASELLETLKNKIGFDGKVIKVIKGKKMEGLKAKHPFIERDSLVVTADFVTTTEGTGVVHIAPGHGEDDYLVGLKYNLDIYTPVDEYGRFIISEHGLKGIEVFKANKKIIDILRQHSALIHKGEISHSYPHCWRCKRPIIFRATEQWFISIEHKGLRKRCLEEIEKVKWIPIWGKERIKGMLETRPDWCISRQRAWGVPITMLRCNNCGEIVKEEKMFQKIVNMVKQKGSDIWFKLDVKDILPAEYKCKCGSNYFIKEQDILDVWFDSGVSYAAVLQKDKRLKWPSEMYLEGSDQHRGWFQSSLIASVGTRGCAPYNIVLTHGFVVDGQGKKMSKSLGNVISPDEVIKQHGAEILRLWVSAENYRDDVRLSKEILRRLVEAYRKIRNTCRFLLGNLYDFDYKDYSTVLLEIDRWAMCRLQKLIKKITDAYDRYDFHEVFHRIYNFCIVDLSSFYLHILKDRLYTSAPASAERRSAQWTIEKILNVITKLIAPILSFTAEEIWQQMVKDKKLESVFLSDFPKIDERFIDEQLQHRWQMLIEVRDVVLKALEIKRAEKFIGDSLEAKVIIYTTGEYLTLLRQYIKFLPTLFVVSQVEIKDEISFPMTMDAFKEKNSAMTVIIERAEGKKCHRCWKWSISVGSFLDEPQVCEECYQVLKKIINNNEV